MARKFKLEPVEDKSRDRWKLDVPASLSPDGRRQRLYFPTRDAARKHAKNLQPGNVAGNMTPRLANDAEKAREILDGTGQDIDLTMAARTIRDCLASLNGCGTLLEACQAFRAAYDARTASRPLGEAVEAFLEGDRCGHLRPATARSYGYTLRQVVKPLHHILMADITTDQIDSLLSGKGTTARRMHRRNLRVFWKWACTAPRSWGCMAVVDALELPRETNDSDIEVLSASDVRALLDASLVIHPHAAAAYAIAIFGGVRMNELGQLRWEDVQADNIEIGKRIAKKRSRRLVPICDALRAWIDHCRGDARPGDKITPENWADVSKACRRLAGWEVVARILEDPPESVRGVWPKPKEPTRGKWPSNAPRHTCASVQIATGAKLEDLTFGFGHAQGHDMLKSHYVGRMTKRGALEILAVMPPGAEAAPAVKVI